MSEARLSVRVDENVKKSAEQVFRKQGMTLSAAINLYLHQASIQQCIPITLLQTTESEKKKDLRKQIEETKAQTFIKSILIDKDKRDVPVALYDDEKKQPYLEYPDGRKVYEIV